MKFLKCACREKIRILKLQYTFCLKRENNLLEVGELCDFHSIHPNLPAQSPGTKHLLVVQANKHLTIQLCDMQREGTNITVHQVVEKNIHANPNKKLEICLNREISTKEIFCSWNTVHMYECQISLIKWKNNLTGLSQLSSTKRISWALTSIPFNTIK